MTTGAALGAAIRWSYVMDGGRQVISGLVALVLAALLGPEAFGLIAMALVYVFFIELLLRQGMAAAVIQREDLGRAHLDTAFWIVMGGSLVLTAAAVGLSGWWATLNRTPELEAVILGLTITIPLQGATVVQEAILRREFRFRALALRTNVSVLAGGATGVVLALSGFGVWAMVAQHVVTAGVAVVILWAISDWRPGLSVSSDAAAQLLRFSGGSLLGSLGVFVVNRSDALLIGLLFGPAVVGLYRLANRLIEMVTGVTVTALMSVSLPELSRAQSDPELFRERVLRLTWVSALLTVPLLGVLAGAGEAALRVLGEEWSAAVWALRLLCVAGAVRALFAVVGPMLQALGRPYEQAVVAWTVGLVSAAGFLLAALFVRGSGVPAQLGGLALSQALLYGLVFTAICAELMRRRAGVTIGELRQRVGPAITAAVAAAASGVVFARVVAPSDAPWIDLIAASLVAGLAAVAVLSALDHVARSYLVRGLERARALRRQHARADLGR